MATNIERDEVSGTDTTGHEWDGIKELNTPLPKWWLYVLYACIIWSIVYWIVMPAWPTGGEGTNDYTGGVIGYSQREVVTGQLADARAAQSQYIDAIEAAELEEIAADDELLRFSLAGGAAAFGNNCAACHGSGAQGFKGYPNLNDDAWIWGGTLEDIHTTLLYGIRWEHDETRFNAMPAYGTDGILTSEEIDLMADYVMSISGQIELPAEQKEAGATIYTEQCAGCHGDEGKGLTELGAPNLTDSIWLYGGEKADLVETIHYSRAGVMPGWVDRLDPATIKQLTVYVHSLGGGQ